MLPIIMTQCDFGMKGRLSKSCQSTATPIPAWNYLSQCTMMLHELMDKRFHIKISDDGQPALSLVFDSSYARETFGFQPTVDMHEGLRRLCQQ